MACQLQPPPPPPSPSPESSPPAPTTILTIGDDLLLEIFLRLPSLPTLVRAAFACRTFLNTIRSSPTFRPAFHALYPPPLIGLFLTHREGNIPSFAPLRGVADKDHAAVLRGSDFFLTRVPDDQGCWNIRDCRDGYLLLHNERNGLLAAYNPLARALHRIPSPPTEPLRELYILSERHGSFRLVCVHEDGLQVRAVVFSSDSGDWQLLPWTDAATINKDHPTDDDKRCLPPAPTTGKLVNGRVYWARNDYLIVLDTATLRFSSMDLPPPMDGQKPFVVGETKDEQLCMVCAIDHRLTVAIWVRRADDDDVEKWMLDREVALPEIPAFKLAAATRGFLHLYLMARNDPNIVPLCSVFSFCLETPPADAEPKKIFSLYQYELERSYPYVMPWPSSLACNKMNPPVESI
ncbi:hypothetical protein QYE76_057613 [Lolium multiflorum]|uniref:F-box protein AT5G49610-like beta-propeller domain-containing protein n=1 Tax=Lolium multiflorum TaxID=4521 RepID=A0AAD8T4J1_LOLMU|nr:hypothetical protein QYE76_057613 [Lolium multiflorum]